MGDTAMVLGGLASIDEATVLSADGLRATVKSAAFGTAEVRSAIGAIRAGDLVLVATSGGGARYVIGSLRALRAADGSSASLEEEGGRELLRVRDARGEVVFEHRPEEARTVLRVPAGALEIIADAGDLALRASGKVTISGDEGVIHESAGPVVMRTDGSELALEGDRARLTTKLLAAAIERADARLAELNIVAGTLRSVAHRVKQKAGEIETDAGRIVERAKDVYREVEGLSQTRAGRVRLLAEHALTLFGESAELAADEDVKIKGEKIYLG
jgi:hypothetical protein